MAGKSTHGGPRSKGGSPKPATPDSAAAPEAAPIARSQEKPVSGAAPPRARRQRTPAPAPFAAPKEDTPAAQRGGGRSAKQPRGAGTDAPGVAPGQAPTIGSKEARADRPTARQKAVPGRSPGPGRRRRTAKQGLSETPGQQRGEQATAAIGKLTKPLQQLRFLQDFFQNPIGATLGAGPPETSTPAAEIAGRMSEIKYQLKVVDALQTVLRQEMQELERALPAGEAAAGEQTRA